MCQNRIVDRDVLAVILLVFIRYWCRLAMCQYKEHVPGDDRCISILNWAVVDWRISILAVQTKDYSLSGSQWYRVGIALFDRGHPSFQNFHPTILVDVVRVKSYVNNLFNATCVPMWVPINKLNFVPEWTVPDRTSALGNIGWLCSSKPHLPIVFLNPFKQRSCCLSNEHLTTPAGDLVDYSILFS